MNNNSNPEAQEAVLKIRTDGQNRRFILVADELMTIGRGSSCAIQIQDQSVSRKHCVAALGRTDLGPQASVPTGFGCSSQ